MQRPAQRLESVSGLTSATVRGLVEAMDCLVAVPGIHAARLIHKMEGLVLERGAAYGAADTFSLFASTMLGSGDFLVDHAGIRGDVRVSIKTDETRFHLSGVTEDVFLAVVADNRLDWEPLRAQVNKARRSLRQALACEVGGPSRPGASGP